MRKLRHNPSSSDFIQTSFFDANCAPVPDHLELIVFDELIDDFAAHTQIFGCLTDRHQRQVNIFRFIRQIHVRFPSKSLRLIGN